MAPKNKYLAQSNKSLHRANATITWNRTYHARTIRTRAMAISCICDGKIPWKTDDLIAPLGRL
jgi:hypothetical protein